MARRIGFGDGRSEKTAPVRRRGAPERTRAPERSNERDHDARSADRERETQPQRGPAAPHGPWIEQPSRPARPARKGGLSIGKLVILGFIWVVLINWTLAAFGGADGAMATIRAVVEGEIDALPALFPAIMLAAVGLFATQLILGRRRKK